MPIDIFPIIDIPVVEVAWSYGGLSAEDMERRIVFVAERNYSTSVNGIERIESESIPGAGLVKIYFQQGADIGAGIAQITAANDNIMHFMPPGVAAPFVIQFDASNLPVVQMVLASAVLPEQQVYDFAVNYIRTRLFTIPGLSVPAPFGGRQRMIVVEADPARLSAQGLAAADLVASLQTSNVIVPAGLARIGEREYNVGLNSSPTDVERFNELPVGVRKGVTVLLGDVAKVYDSSAVQTNIVHVDGHRAAYLPILKHSDASTLTVVNDTRDILPRLQAAAPQGLRLNLAFDQSVFVRAAVNNVLREAIASSLLVSLMILVFLGSWRSTLIVSLSIPLSICAGPRRAVPHRSDHQSHDAGRAGARGRPARRQCDGGGGEHPPQSGAGKAPRGRHHGWHRRSHPAFDRGHESTRLARRGCGVAIGSARTWEVATDARGCAASRTRMPSLVVRAAPWRMTAYTSRVKRRAVGRSCAVL